MLEKMGWSKGKGLGVNLDGEQNFIKVSHKIDQKGIGFEDRDDQWTQHENQFNSLLKSLDNSAGPSENEDDNDDAADELSAMSFRGFGFAEPAETSSKKKKKSITDTLSGKSLEEMSKNSKARVHYKKFTRGKDLTKYSEKDLANIFGKKVMDDASEMRPSDEEVAKQKNADEPLSNYGITTIETGTTISDYFHNKKSNLLKCNSAADESSASASNSLGLNDDEDQQKPDKKRKKQKHDMDVELAELAFAELQTKKDKKSKKKEELIVPVEVIELDEDVDVIPTGTSSKKKNKKRKEKRENSEPETVAQIGIDTPIIIEDSPVTKIKKKKSKKRDDSDEAEEVPSTAEVTTLPNPIISNILSTLIYVNNLADSPTEQRTNASVITAGTESSKSTPTTDIHQFAHETFEINRYQAELFRFVDLDGFNNANLSDLTGYGFNKNIDLKITARTQDRNRINDLWDNALINKYGKDVIKAKKKQKYSLKSLKNKKLFKAIWFSVFQSINVSIFRC